MWEKYKLNSQKPQKLTMEENKFITVWKDLPLLEEDPEWVYYFDITSETGHYITFTTKKYVHSSISYCEVFNINTIIFVIKSAYGKSIKKQIHDGKYGSFIDLNCHFLFCTNDVKIIDKGRNKDKFCQKISIIIRDKFTKSVIDTNLRARKFFESICTCNTLFKEYDSYKVFNCIMKVRLGQGKKTPIRLTYNREGTLCGDNGGETKAGKSCKNRYTPEYKNDILSRFYGRCKKHPRKLIPTPYVVKNEVDIGKKIQCLRFYPDKNYFQVADINQDMYNVTYYYARRGDIIHRNMDIINGKKIEDQYLLLPTWTYKTHYLYPTQFKKEIKTWLLITKREKQYKISKDIMFFIIKWIVYLHEKINFSG